MARIARAVAVVMLVIASLCTTGCLHTWTQTYHDYPPSAWKNPPLFIRVIRPMVETLWACELCPPALQQALPVWKLRTNLLQGMASSETEL